MSKHKVKPNYRRRLLRLPDLDHCKRAVLNSLGSPASRRVYEYAIDQFIAWYYSEPRLAFNRIVTSMPIYFSLLIKALLFARLVLRTTSTYRKSGRLFILRAIGILRHPLRGHSGNLVKNSTANRPPIISAAP